MNYDEIEYFLLHHESRKPAKVPQERILGALREVVQEQKVPSDAQAFRALVLELRGVFHLDITTDAFRSGVATFAWWLKNALVFLFVVFCSYVVLGGVSTGQDVLMHGFPAWASLAVLVCLLITLAVVEGLEVSVLSLQLRRLDAVRTKFPRAYSTHAEVTASGKTVARFLSGRQVFVIMLVFLIAQLTSFPEMTMWPFTSIPLPDWMSPWFQLIFLKWGLLGAFVAVWIGQLAPKLIANDDSIKFLNVWNMKVITKLALFTDALGLTLPSSWISKSLLRGHTSREFPYTQEEEYRTKVTSFGYDTSRYHESIEFDGDRFKATSKKSTLMGEPIPAFYDAKFLEGKPRAFKDKPSATLLRADGKIDGVRITTHNVTPATSDGIEGTEYYFEVQRNHGNFEPGDILFTSMEISSSGYEAERHSAYKIEVISPTRLLEVKVKLKGYYLSSARAIITARASRGSEQREELSVIEEPSGPALYYVKWFPELYSTHEVRWVCDRA